MLGQRGLHGGGAEMVRFTTGTIAALILLLAGAVAMATPSAGPMGRGAEVELLLAPQRDSPPPRPSPASMFRPQAAPPSASPAPPDESLLGPGTLVQSNQQQRQQEMYRQQQRQQEMWQRQREQDALRQRQRDQEALQRRQREDAIRQQQRQQEGARQQQNLNRQHIQRQENLVRRLQQQRQFQTMDQRRRTQLERESAARQNQAMMLRSMSSMTSYRRSDASVTPRSSPMARKAAAVQAYRQASAFVPPAKPARPTALITRAASTQQFAPRVAGVAKAATTTKVIQPGALKSKPGSTGSNCTIKADAIGADGTDSQHRTEIGRSNFQVASLDSLAIASHGAASLIDYPTFSGWQNPPFPSARKDEVLVADAGCGKAKSIDFGARAARVDKAQQGHANSMHGAGTTLDQQRLRAQDGVPPDSKRPNITSHASRFTDAKYQDAAYRMARNQLYIEQRKFPHKSVHAFPVKMGRTIGEGYLKGGKDGDYRTTNVVWAVFRNGKLFTMYPAIEKYPNDSVRR